VLAFAGLWFVTRRERRTTAALKTHMPHDAAGVRLLTRKGAKKGFFHHRKKKKTFFLFGGSSMENESQSHNELRAT
jgi:hypothetical protein